VAGVNSSTDAKLAALQSLAEIARCGLHRKPGSYIVIVEEIWTSGSDIGEYKPFLRTFPDNEKGYDAARSAVIRRYPFVGEPVIICSACSQEKPYTEYDKRFLGKSVRKVCADCRASEAISPELEARRAVRAQRERERQERIERARQEYQERYPRRTSRFVSCQSIADMQRVATEIDEDQTFIDEWREYCRSLGLSSHDMRNIAFMHDILRHSYQPWSDMKRGFLALDPPYLGTLNRNYHRLTAAQERAMYAEQDGKCAYCDCELLPLSYRKIRTRAVRWDELPDFTGEMPPDGMVMVDGDRIPQVEHRTPISRGGGDELANLCFACRACNYAKGVRTEKEYKEMPDDVISHQGGNTAQVLKALTYEKRGYLRFDDVNTSEKAYLLVFADW
jgi:hypothetical protein